MIRDVIFCEDCKITLNNPEIKFDYVITAIPDLSEIGYDPDKSSDTEKYFSFIGEVYEGLTLKSNIITTLTTDRKSGGKIHTKNAKIVQIFKKLGYVPLSYKIWIKSEKINLYRLNYAHIITFVRKGSSVTVNNTDEFVDDMMFAHHENIEDFTRGFPLSIVDRLILEYTKPGDVVFDPFMGSGTVAVSAKNNGRSYLGSEIDPKTWEIADRRIRNLGVV